ncbi:MAG: hypothetical protein IPP97_17265 [Candidatus Obscuribacter sp.]|nr:hypothetical protein [Candidatus Obscuribacter sp.]
MRQFGKNTGKYLANSLERQRCGFSILETLVSVVVMGIAIAGITELLWVNTSWNTKLLNKFDNFYAGKQLLGIFSKEFRSCCRIKFTSNTTNITVVRPILNEVNNGFIGGTEEITYELLPDTTDPSGSYLMKIHDGRVLLRGIVGPKVVGRTEPQVFQYLEKNVSNTDPKMGLRDSANSNTGSVVVNLELKRVDNGTMVGVTPKSELVLRSEYLIRNGSIHGR